MKAALSGKVTATSTGAAVTNLTVAITPAVATNGTVTVTMTPLYTSIGGTNVMTNATFVAVFTPLTVVPTATVTIHTNTFLKP